MRVPRLAFWHMQQTPNSTIADQLEPAKIATDANNLRPLAKGLSCKIARASQHHLIPRFAFWPSVQFLPGMHSSPSDIAA